MCEGNTQLLCINLPAAVSINESEDEISNRPVGIVTVAASGAIGGAAANIIWSQTYECDTLGPELEMSAN